MADRMHMIDVSNFGTMEVLAWINVDVDDVRWMYPVGVYSTLPEMLQDRPLGYRYAAGKQFYLSATGSPVYCVVDMLDLTHDSDLVRLWVGWHRTYPELDAAIMAAMIRGNP